MNLEIALYISIIGFCSRQVRNEPILAKIDLNTGARPIEKPEAFTQYVYSIFPILCVLSELHFSPYKLLLEGGCGLNTESKNKKAEFLANLNMDSPETRLNEIVLVFYSTLYI